MRVRRLDRVIRDGFVDVERKRIAHDEIIVSRAILQVFSEQHRVILPLRGGDDQAIPPAQRESGAPARFPSDRRRPAMGAMREASAHMSTRRRDGVRSGEKYTISV